MTSQVVQTICCCLVLQEWLHELLPADAAERCRDQVSIVVTQLPFCNQVAISDFQDKTDLVNVAMASAHVPLFLDWKASRLCRGVQCLDGSFPDFFTGANCDFLTCNGDAVMFDYFDVSAALACLCICTCASCVGKGCTVSSIMLILGLTSRSMLVIPCACPLSVLPAALFADPLLVHHCCLQDPHIVRNGRMDMLELKEFKQIKKIILLGYRFAQRKHEEGEFDRFDMTGMLKQQF